MLELIKASINDLKTLMEIKNDAFKNEFKEYGFTPSDIISYQWHKDMLEKSIYYVIVNNERVIGGVNIFIGDSYYYLCSLFIKLKEQNKGIGSKVINMLENLHNEHNTWTLETPSMSVSNNQFYKKCGYSLVSSFTPKGAPQGFTLNTYKKIIK